MVNQQLLDYIKQQQQAGKSREEITHNLINGGWKPADVEQGFASVASGIPAPVSAELPKARQIFDESWVVYKNHFKTFVAISAVPYIGFLLLGALVGITAVLGTTFKLKAEAYSVPLIIFALIALVFIIYVAIWGAVAQLIAIRDHGENIGWKESFKRARGKIGPFFTTHLLAGLAVLGGTLLLIVPGIIFGLWFSQVSYIVIEEGLSNSTALKRSKHYVKGRIGSIFGKLFYIGIITAGIYILISIILGIIAHLSGLKQEDISWISNIFSLIWSPMMTVYGYQVYKHAKTTRP